MLCNELILYHERYLLGYHELVYETVTCFQSSDDSRIFDTQLINWFADT